MGPKAVELTEEENFYAQLSDYLDENLSNDARRQCEETAKRLHLVDAATDFGIRRGRLQIESQRLFLNEKDLRDIHDLVEDDATRANSEAADIEGVGRSELKGNVLRFLILFGLAAFFIYGGYTLFGPKEKAPFKALDSLIYEAIVMSEDPEGRLDFPTDKLAEINNFFQRSPELGFVPKALQEPGDGWVINGGTVIDYDVAKILGVQFTGTNTEEKLFLFMYKGELSQLPSSAPGNHQGIVYQAYASDRLNIVAWQAAPDTTAMMIGFRGARELAELAFRIVGL